jgi:membrane-associated phospholipid phosphatase
MNSSWILLYLENLPFLSGFLSIGLLIFLQEIHLLLFYIVGFIANELLNRVMKPIIQDPRPVPMSSTDIYGMPSEHSQLAAYSLVFMTLVLREKHYGWILLFLGLTVATMAQRVITKVHSLEQVIIGGLLGGVLGYIFHKFASSMFARKYITENK